MAFKTAITTCSLSVAEIENFVVTHDSLFEGKLSNFYNYSRVVSLADFKNLVSERELTIQDHVGVISGSIREPELKLLNPRKVTLLNFSEDSRYDLDSPWNSYESYKFSFTICNQVFEHIFDQHLAIDNLIHQTRSGGHIYLSMPTLNCIHGEPFFYSSGFHPRFLERLAVQHGLIPLSIGFWGSFKYLINAVSGRWLTSAQLRPGFRQVKDLQYPSLIFQDGRRRSPDDKYITDCWGLFQKP